MRIDIPDLVPEPSSEKGSLLKMSLQPEGDPSTAQVALIGEAPSWQEMKENRLWCGPAGQVLDRVLGLTTLPRYSCYLDNFCMTQLPKNSTNILWNNKGYRHSQYYELQAALMERLSKFQGSLIVLMGETALRGVIDYPQFDSIGKFRGSIYSTNDFPHLSKVVPNKFILPTYHPSFALPNANPTAFHIILNDINKGISFLNDPSVLDQKLTIHTQPSYSQIIEFTNEVLTKPETAFDIEATPDFVTCLSLSLSPTEAMSIPLMDNHGNYWSPSDEANIIQQVAKILQDERVGKIAQNGMFDFMFMLKSYNIKVRNFLFDTMLAQHICWTDLPKGLDFLASIYTYLQYYKDEGKLSHLKAIKDWPQYWHYNAKDAIATHQCKAPLEDELSKLKGAREVFDYSMTLHKPLMEMEYRGILTNPDGISQMRAQLQDECVTLKENLKSVVGYDLNPRSSQQLIKYFYFDCGYRPYLNRKSGKPTCDEVALVGLARKGSEAAQVIRTLRKKENMISKYFTTVADTDNRLRCTYKICGTKYGRLSSEATYQGTGTNLQNQTPLFKQFLTADPGYILVEPDLAKAEAHVVAYLCQDQNMIEAFEAGVDVHTYNAHKIFETPMEEVTKKQRNMGKRVVHASNYGMGPQTFSNNLAKDDIFMNKNECKRLLEAYARRFPGLHRWHKEISDEVYRTRILYNLFNRPKRFLGMINTALLMSAYSYKPQSTVAGLLNRGMVKMANDPYLSKTYDGKMLINMLATVHDSVLFQVPVEFAGELCNILQRIEQHMYHKFTYRGKSFVIGTDAKIGYNWGKDMAEVKHFTPDVVENALSQIGVQV